MDERQKAFDAFEKTGLFSVKAGLNAGTHGTWAAFAQEWVALKEAGQTEPSPIVEAGTLPPTPKPVDG